jgi:hypothetical protein
MYRPSPAGEGLGVRLRSVWMRPHAEQGFITAKDTMQIKIKYRRSFLVMSAIIAFVFILTQCTNNKNNEKKQVELGSRFEDYAGSAACAGCHKEIYETHIKTAHYNTGQPVTNSNIMGSFSAPDNTYAYSSDIKLSMQKRDSAFYQVVYFKGEEKKAMPFNWVIGSGVLGQSYLTWRNNALFQLPITYFTAAKRWSNSPGFPANKVMIDRPITARCLECHTTYATGISGTEMEPIDFDRSKFIYGVDCEKCHGPAKEHVDYQTGHPSDTTGKFIVNPAHLPKQRKLDVCALCHGGDIQKTRPSFEFTAGKKLSDYFTIEPAKEINIQNSTVDVHGNQYALFTASKCFSKSAELTCITCHNTHEKERGNMELFSQRCMNCHNTGEAKFKTTTHQQVTAIEKDCINCHMPAQPSKSIAVFIEGEEIPRASLLRSHFIGIYPEETTKFKNSKHK